MKDQDMFNVINDIDEDLITEAQSAPAGGASRAGTARILLLAAIALLICGLIAGSVFLLRKGSASPLQESDAETALPAKETDRAPAQTTAQTNAQKTAATVYLDVNPSVGVAIDESKTVLDVFAANSDGEALLTGVELIGKPVGDAVGTLLTLSVRDGYLTAENNAVLLSVECEDKALGAELCSSL